MPVLPCSVGTSVLDTSVVDDHLSSKSNLLSPELSASRAGAGFERRVAWLEEDVAVLHRRLRDECGEGSNAGGSAAGDLGLRGLVARLDGELASERRAREVLEARVHHLDDRIFQESLDRKTQLESFSNELEDTMRALIRRIDDGLSASTTAMAERTGQTEDRLRTLLQRVDEGLSAGAAALQDTLTQAGPKLTNGYETEAPQTEAPQTDADAENLIQAWDELRQENEQLRLQCAQRATEVVRRPFHAQQGAVVYANRPQVACGGSVGLMSVGGVSASGSSRPVVVSAHGTAPGVAVYRAAQPNVRMEQTP